MYGENRARAGCFHLLYLETGELLRFTKFMNYFRVRGVLLLDGVDSGIECVCLLDLGIAHDHSFDMRSERAFFT